MTLPEAIVYLLASSNHGMKTDQIARLVNEKGADSLREDRDAGPDSGDGKGAFRGDDVLFHRIGHGVGEKHLVHSVLEFAGTDALLSFAEDRHYGITES